MIPITAKKQFYLNKILRCAAQIRKNEGVRAVTLNRVTQETHISKTTFYKYFRSIEALLSDPMMESGEPTDTGATSMKEHLLELIVKNYRQKGIKAIHMGGIARDAGMQRASLYKYFSSKYDIAEYLLQYELEKGKEFLEYYRKENDDPVSMIELVLKFPLDAMKSRERTMLWMILVFHFLKSDRIRKMYQKLNKHSEMDMIQRFEAAKRKGIFPAGMDTGELIKLLLVISYGLILYQHIHPEDGISDSMIRLYSEKIFRSLRELPGDCQK